MISTSKIKNTIPMKKNFKENGTREKENGSYPHSNGDNFSLFFKLLNCIKINIIIINNGINIKINIINKII